MKNLIAVVFILSIDLYVADFCPYCRMAEHLLKTKGIEYKKHDVSIKEEKIEMMKKTGGKTTIPQIFINNQYIGGYDNLVRLDKSGKLDQMIKSNV